VREFNLEETRETVPWVKIFFMEAMMGNGAVGCKAK
jgi:hypothetical protein